MKLRGKKAGSFPMQEELINLLKREISIHSIYVISSTKEKEQKEIFFSGFLKSAELTLTYTLLLITHKPIKKRLGDLMDEVYYKMQKRCKVYLLPYSLSNVKKSLNNGDRFLNGVLSQARYMYKENNVLSKYQNQQISIYSNDFKQIETHWINRMERARYLLFIIDMTNIQEDYTAKLATMHTALEQICLGLLYLFWEFKPHHYSLTYLLHLCGHFTDLPQKIFPKTSYGLQRQFYMLCNAHHIMRFKETNDFSEKDAFKAQNLCERFFEQAESLGQRQLEKLQILQDSKSLVSSLST